MPIENELTAFTIRVPVSLEKRIRARGRQNTRSRNGECLVLLEMALDLAEARDRRGPAAEAQSVH